MQDVKKFFPLLLVSLLNANESMDDLLMMDFAQLYDTPVISATKSLTPLSKIPATIRVITSQQIHQRGYTTLEEALSDLPGMQFRNFNGFNTYTFMRGAPSQNNLILLMIDGIKINEINSGGFYGGLQHNLENIKRIEIMYGPSSVLYGTNAISGIINIITYSPQDYADGTGSTISTGYGSFDTSISDFRTGYFDKESGLGFTLSGRYAKSEKADLGGSAGDNNWNEDMENFENSYDIDGKFQYKDFEFGFVYQDKQSSNTTEYKTIGDIYKDSDTLWHVSFLNLWARHNYAINSDLSLSSLLYYRDTTVEDDSIGKIVTTPSPGYQKGHYRPNSLWGVEERFDYKLNTENKITLGLVYESEKVSKSFSNTYSASSDIAPEAPNTPEQIEEDVSSVYVQSRHDVMQNINLTLALRYDDSSVYGKVWTPRVALIYDNDENYRLKAFYSEGYRAPRPWDYTSGSGNSSLDEERMRSYELGFDYFFNDSLSTNITLYRNKILNKLVKDSVANRWVNSGFLETKGLELSVDYHQTSYELFFNYTYTDSQDENGVKTKEISMHTANTGVHYAYDKHWALMLKLNFTGERENPKVISATGSDIIDDALIFSSQLSYYDFYSWDMHLQLRNMSDETYYHTSNFSTTDRYRQPQRSFFLKGQYRF